MKLLLLLGDKGMLGDAVSKYFLSDSKFELRTISERWPSDTFGKKIIAFHPDFIINAIGKIPQRASTEGEYTEINVRLPLFLDTLGIPVIHPSTDCEFSGEISLGEAYTKLSVRDARDPYGISKAEVSSQLETSAVNTKIIRTSIVGHERETHVSLLDWFLNAEGSVRGYTNHYWNGITTLQWAERAKAIMEDWDSFPTLNQYSTHPYQSKYDVLQAMREAYARETDIAAYETPEAVNKCLVSDIPLPSLSEQLASLRTFYQR